MSSCTGTQSFSKVAGISTFLKNNYFFQNLEKRQYHHNNNNNDKSVSSLQAVILRPRLRRNVKNQISVSLCIQIDVLSTFLEYIRFKKIDESLLTRNADNGV